MKYKERSLLEFCRHLNIDLSNVQHDLSAIKKQIKLEFKAAEDGIIMIESNQYDYNFVTQALENPNLAVEIEYEIIISKVAWLNDVINKYTVDFSAYIEKSKNGKHVKIEKFKIPHQYDSDAFRAYLSPRLAISFNIISKRLLSEDLFFKQLIVMNLQEFIQQKDYEVAFQYISFMLAETVRTIRNSNKENFRQKGNSIQRWAQNCSGDVLNALPDYFQNKKTEFAVVMTNFLVDIQHADNIFAYQLSRQMVKIKNLSPELTTTINKNHQIFEDRKNGIRNYGTQKGDNSSVWTVFYALIFIIKFLYLVSMLAR